MSHDITRSVTIFGSNLLWQEDIDMLKPIVIVSPENDQEEINHVLSPYSSKPKRAHFI